MHRVIASITLVIGLLLSPSLAFSADGAEQALSGLNGVVTSPADVVVGGLWEGLILGEDRYNLPGPISNVVTEAVSDRVVGLVVGTCMTPWRLLTGIADVFLAPTPIEEVGPKARYALIPGVKKPLPEKPVGF